ncbi:hypothetical protein M9H77_04629 [Catharanthus roseus]|uniref:Uncharacterized protein n=1 Tax=Catharanthus roseus TaxID=4058 RepID=A0ACC0CER0_CATRO|nr:hypothetical protein M9H77_04629 [Catharanthus roseus]
MLRKFSDLISASKLNTNARECIKEGFKIMKNKIINEGRSFGIKDLVGRRVKRVCNIRKKSIAKIKCNQARGNRKSTLTHALRIKTTVQLSMTNEYLGKDLNAQNKRRFTSSVKARTITSVSESAHTLSLCCSCRGVGCCCGGVGGACVSK